MKGIIQIVGPIGTFVLNNKPVNGVQLKNVIAQVTALPAEVTELQVDIATDGGNKETGDSIYNYLVSLQSKYKIIMNQIGDIGSIGTKIWFAGNPIDGRIALKGINPETGMPYELFVHNPWMRLQGDSKVIAAALAEIQPEEEELKNFYMAQTGITAEGIGPLMDSQTGIDADMAVQMKFATSTREALKIAAYKMKIKTEDEKKLGGLLETILAYFKDKPAAAAAAVAAVPAVPGAAPAADLSASVGKTVTVDGAAPLDGVYSVKGGVVTAVETLAEEDLESVALANKVAEAEKIIAALKMPKAVDAAEVQAMIEAGVKKGVEEFKSTFKTSHKPAFKEVIIDFKNQKETPIQAKQRMLKTGEKV